jgi:dCMP deaminase
VAELVDALVSNTSDSNIVPVRSRPWVQSSSGMSESSTNGNKQLAIDKRYLRMAKIWASNSYCTRKKVGALLVRDKMIISDGYNGTPSGFENQCEDENGVTKSYVLHAEANAITKVAKSNNSSDGSTLYITTSPCMECSKLIIQAGITRVVFEEKYRITDGLDLLERANIELVHIPDSSEEPAPGSIE